MRWNLLEQWLCRPLLLYKSVHQLLGQQKSQFRPYFGLPNPVAARLLLMWEFLTGCELSAGSSTEAGYQEAVPRAPRDAMGE